MKVDRVALLGCLEKLSKGLAVRAMIEQTDKYIIDDYRIITYNDRVSVCHEFPLDGIVGAVDAKSFLQIVKSLKTKELDIRADDDSLIVRSGKTKEAVFSFCEIELPIDEMGHQGGEWFELPDDFLQALTHCRHSVGKDESRPILSCVCFDNGYMYGSDGRKLTRFDLGSESELSFVIPSDCIPAITHNKPVRAGRDETWVYFESEEGTVLSVRQMEGEYPTAKVDMLLDEYKGDIIDFPVDLGLVLKRAEVFSTDTLTNKNLVTVELTEGTTHITSKNDKGMYKEESPNKYKGRDLLFLFPPGMLIDVVDDIIEVRVNDFAILFQTETYSHMIGILK